MKRLLLAGLALTMPLAVAGDPFGDSADVAEPAAPLLTETSRGVSIKLSTEGPHVLATPFTVRVDVETLHESPMTIKVTQTDLEIVGSREFEVSPTQGRAATQFTAVAATLGVYRLFVGAMHSEVAFDERAIFVDFRTPVGSVSATDPAVVVSNVATPVNFNVTPVNVSGQATFGIRMWFVVDNPMYNDAYDDARTRWAKVELWDRESCCGNVKVREGYLDYTGYVAWDVDYNDGPFQGSIDPYVVVYSWARPDGASEDKAIVKDNGGNYYQYRVDWPDNQGGIRQEWHNVPGATGAAFHILGRAMEGYKRAIHWPQNLVVPSGMEFRWQQGHTEGSAYDPNTRTIRINGDPADQDEWDRDIILHEYGHHVFYTMYDYTWSKMPAGAGVAHYWDTCTNKGSAITEGWAGFYQGFAQYLVWEMYGGVRDDNYQDKTTSFEGVYDPLETMSYNWRCTLPTGSAGEYEAQAVGTFWDFHDGANDNQSPTAGSDALSWYGPELLRSLKQYRIYDGGVWKGAQNMDHFHHAFDAEVCCPDTTATHELLVEHDLYYGWAGPH